MGLDVTGRWSYPPPDREWLAQRREPAIEPDRPIIDAHHHIWEEWGRPYLLDELLADTGSGHNVVATVAVQAGYGYRPDGPEELRPVGETEKLAAIAREAERRGGTRACAAIVAFADLTRGDDLAAVLDEHERAADGRLRGIRHSVGYDSNFPDGIVLRPATPHLLADDRYRAGASLLARRGLSFDAMVYHQQIPELAAFARAVPDLSIILDHYGAPIGVGHYEGREAESFDRWREAMADLAQCANVTVKTGGLGMIITGATWHERPAPPSSQELAEAWRPRFEATVELFGAERCIFESNFPVDNAMFGYDALWNAYKRLAADLSEQERDGLFHDNAARIYRI